MKIIYDNEQSKFLELELYPIIINKFNILDLKFTDNKFHKFDYENDDYLIELKSRNNKSNFYKTTIIGYNKIKYGLKNNKKMIFVFKFTDKVQYIEYDKDIFDTFEIKTYASRYDRGRPEISTYIFIDIKYLIDM
jgi:hypothetical protein